ncbi:MAG: hypothetical protein IAG10_29875 [Planctomycetaceae bacterium]|nr:hypothetical protein [Planctomycetaceae bacterium]
MATWALIFTMAVTAQTNPEQNVGQVVGGVGAVSVSNEAGATRGGTTATALQAGDTISTGPGASSLVSLRSKVSVYVGAQTQLRLQTPAVGLQLVQARGEIRVVSNNNDGVTILTPAVEARMKRGILRCGITSAGTRFWAEKGTAELTSREQQAARQRRSVIQMVSFKSAEDQNAATITLKEGQQILYVPGKGFEAPVDGTPKDWTIDPQQLMVSIGQARSQATRSADATNPNTDQGDGSTSRELNSQASTTAGVNFSLGNTLASTAASSGGGLFTDANQNTLSGQLTSPFRGLLAGAAFPGNIHLVTGEQTYTFNDVMLNPTEIGALTASTVTKEFWSIGTGALPTGQITTGIGTGTSATPDAIRIPQFDAFLVRLDQYGIVDPASPVAVGNQDFAVTGLAGNAPFNPEIVGATPLADTRGPNQINQRATFALGELSVSQQDGNPQIGLRRSDQDRKIIKDANGNDNLDQVTPNADVTTFNDVAEPRFFPQVPTVKVPATGPNALSNIPRYSTSDNLRRAAFTTLTAEKLKGFANRTGQTRFVIDGKIVDITGYRGR